MASEGKIYNRTLFYERVPNPGTGGERIRFLPFYLVTMPQLGGRLFEPVDYARGDITEEKEIAMMKEYQGKCNIMHCELDGTPLHSFGGWEYPPSSL